MWKTVKNSYYSYAWPTQYGPMRWLGMQLLDHSGKCTTQSANFIWFGSLDEGYWNHTRFANWWWPMKSRVKHNWPTTRGFLKTNTNRALSKIGLSANIDGPCNHMNRPWKLIWLRILLLQLKMFDMKFIIEFEFMY